MSSSDAPIWCPSIVQDVEIEKQTTRSILNRVDQNCMASEEERKREKVKENEEGDEFISLRRRDVCTERLQRAFKLVGKYWTSSSSTGSTGGSV